MTAAFAHTGSDRSPSITGASDVSIRTARMLGRMNVGEAAVFLCGAAEGAAAATSVNPSGGSAALCAAMAAPHEHANASATVDALAPHVSLLTCNASPRCRSGLLPIVSHFSARCDCPLAVSEPERVAYSDRALRYLADEAAVVDHRALSHADENFIPRPVFPAIPRR